MVKALLSLVAYLRSAWLFECVGAALIVGGAWTLWSDGAALIAAGVALLLKSYEFAMRGDG